MVCDSTNVFSQHPGKSESTVGPEITKLVSEAKGMVVATTFASNVARVKTLAEAGVAAGRSVCLLGRSMRRMVEAGHATGVLAASIFHFGTYTIEQAKTFMSKAGIEVRLDPLV